MLKGNLSPGNFRNKSLMMNTCELDLKKQNSQEKKKLIILNIQARSVIVSRHLKITLMFYNCKGI